jgi:hypothetical protein
MAKIAVLIIHGMGSQSPNFAKSMTNGNISRISTLEKGSDEPAL